MVAWRLSNGQILGIERSSTGEWNYWIYAENGVLLDGGCVDTDHYPFEESLAYDLVYDMGELVTICEEITEDEFYDLEETDLDRMEEKADAFLEVGFNPYMGCYDYDC